MEQCETTSGPSLSRTVGLLACPLSTFRRTAAPRALPTAGPTDDERGTDDKVAVDDEQEAGGGTGGQESPIPARPARPSEDSNLPR